MNGSVADKNGNSCPPRENNLQGYLEQRIVVIARDGSAAFEEQPPNQAQRTVMQEIRQELSSPEPSAADVNRLISQEIANIICEMSLSTNLKKLKAFTVRIAALSALAKAVARNEKLAKHDVLNFDSPKFIFVFDHLLDCYQKATEEALGKNSDLAQRTMKAFRDIVASTEADLRRDTEKIRLLSAPFHG